MSRILGQVQAQPGFQAQPGWQHFQFQALCSYSIFGLKTTSHGKFNICPKKGVRHY